MLSGCLSTVEWLCCIHAAQVSGVIAVVVYGLYGSATAKWGLSPKVAESGVFDNFWDTIGFAITGLVFFFSGVSCVNFFYRSAQVMTARSSSKPQLKFDRNTWLVCLLVS